MPQNNVKTIGERIHEKWEKLSPGDLKEIGEDMGILANKVSSVYDRSKADVTKEIAEFQEALEK